MKRGLIAWDKSELPPRAFETRLKRARERLAELDLPALAVYSDLWRSNYGRFYSNLMLYFNRAILLIPRHEQLLVLCGLSPRVYPWIKSVTVLQEIVPSPDLSAKLVEVCSQRNWRRIGMIDPKGLPYDLHRALAAQLEIQTVPHESDEWERTMHRRARQMAWDGLNEELPASVGMLDREFVGQLERSLRRAGAEDLAILTTNGDRAPAPPSGQTLHDGFSVSVALEYRGHWTKIAQHHGSADSAIPRAAFLEVLSGALPFEICETPPEGAVVASALETRDGARRYFSGDAFWSTKNSLEPL